MTSLSARDYNNILSASSEISYFLSVRKSFIIFGLSLEKR